MLGLNRTEVSERRMMMDPIVEQEETTILRTAAGLDRKQAAELQGVRIEIGAMEPDMAG